MKQIELRVVQGSDRQVYNYKDLILTIARTHPQGISIADMEKAVRVIARTRDANGVLRLEDADWETLKTYIQAFPFSYASAELLQFWKDVAEAPEVEV